MARTGLNCPSDEETDFATGSPVALHPSRRRWPPTESTLTVSISNRVKAWRLKGLRPLRSEARRRLGTWIASGELAASAEATDFVNRNRCKETLRTVVSVAITRVNCPGDKGNDSVKQNQRKETLWTVQEWRETGLIVPVMRGSTSRTEIDARKLWELSRAWREPGLIVPAMRGLTSRPEARRRGDPWRRSMTSNLETNNQTDCCHHLKGEWQDQSINVHQRERPDQDSPTWFELCRSPNRGDLLILGWTQSGSLRAKEAEVEEWLCQPRSSHSTTETTRRFPAINQPFSVPYNFKNFWFRYSSGSWLDLKRNGLKLLI